MNREPVLLSVTLSPKTYDFVERFCSTVGITHDYFINSILDSASDDLEGFIMTLERAKAGELSKDELQALHDRLDGILTAFERVKL